MTIVAFQADVLHTAHAIDSQNYRLGCAPNMQQVLIVQEPVVNSWLISMPEVMWQP